MFALHPHNAATIPASNMIALITFGFDDEFEDQLSKSVQRFGDFMTREYDSNRYMGD